MLTALDRVFDDLYPLNGRRATLFSQRQGQENWVEWISSLGDDWEECGMHSLVMDHRPAKLLKLHRYRNIEGKMHPNFSCFGTCFEFSKLHFRSAFL